MRIWIDGQCLQTASADRGIGRYVIELIGGIAVNCKAVDLALSFNAGMPERAIFARDLVAPWIGAENIYLWQGVAEGGEATHGLSGARRLSELALSHHVDCLAPDVALSASPFEGMGDPAAPMLPEKTLSCPVAAIFYDAIPHRYPDQYFASHQSATAYARRLRKLASFDTLLAISSFAANEARDLVPGVACHAIDAGPSSNLLKLLAEKQDLRDPAALRLLGVKQPYMLYVGALDWRKNVGTAIDAIAKLPTKLRTGLAFVIAGAFQRNDAAALQARWTSLGLPPPNLIFLERVSDEVLVRLYSSAELVIQPSLMEGFGLTALEAQICGATVIGAKAGALPEVIGDERALFDPTSAADIAAIITSIESDQELKQSIAAAERKQASGFSWKRTAERTVEALQKVIESKTGSKSGGTAKHTSIDEKRRAILPLLSAIDATTELKIEALARAEIPPATKPRLLIEVSCITANDNDTGIQRVVRKIIEAWHQGASAKLPWDIELISCSSSDDFLPVKLEFHGNKSRFVLAGQEPVRPARGDKILLLDSSWDYHKRHAKLLKKARVNGTDVIAFIYDLIPLKYPAFCGPGVPDVYGAGLRVLLENATSAICISKAVCNELHTLLTTVQFGRELPLGYVHLGADFNDVAIPQADSNVVPLGTRPPTFLMVGTLEPRKGQRVAMKAFENLWRTNCDACLVIVGKPGWGTEVLAENLKTHVENGARLKWLSRVTDEELVKLYSECDAVIAASYAEGFGLPLVEAERYGKPIIASDIPVFREIMDGNASCRYFDVGSSTSLAATIREFIADQTPAPVTASKPMRSWHNWTDSANDLAAFMRGERIYRHYEPRTAKAGDGRSIGRECMIEHVPPSERRYRIDLADDPALSLDRATVKLILCVTNLSSAPWFSRGPSGPIPGVYLSYHLLDEQHRSIRYDGPRIAFPMGVAPGERHYTAIDIPAQLIGRYGGFVDIEILQEGVAWWGKAARFPVNAVVPTPPNAISADQGRR